MYIIHRKVLWITQCHGKSKKIYNFQPGMNEISDSEFEDIKDHYSWKSEISCGNMIIGGHYETETQNTTKQSDHYDPVIKSQQEILDQIEKKRIEIESLPMAKAKKVIKESNDLIFLNRVNFNKEKLNEIKEARRIEVKRQITDNLKPVNYSGPDGSDFAKKMDKIPLEKVVSGDQIYSEIPGLQKDKEIRAI